MSQRCFRLFATTSFVACVVPLLAMSQDVAPQPPSLATTPVVALDWESANAKRMFILVNDGSAISAISVDTTHIEDLRAALRLQELVFRISGTRMPLVDKQFVTVPWGKIHIAWDHNPMTERQHAFEITMKETDPTSYNPPKQIIIAGSAGDVASAVSAFTEATLGVPLDALNDEEYKWKPVKTVAIPEKMNTILGKFKAK